MDKFNKLTRGFVVVAATAVVAVTGLVIATSLLRYLLGKSIGFTEELCGLLFVLISFLTIPYAFQEGRQIRITIVLGRLPQRVRDYIEIAGNVITVLFLAWFIKIAFHFAWESFILDAHSLTAELYLPPWMMLIPLSLGIFGIAVIISTFTKIVDLKKEAKS